MKERKQKKPVEEPERTKKRKEQGEQRIGRRTAGSITEALHGGL